MSLIKKKKNHSLNVFPVKMIRNFFLLRGGEGGEEGEGEGRGKQEWRRAENAISHPIILISSLSPPSTKTNTSVSEE